MNATQQAFKALYFEDCVVVTVNPYSVIRDWIDGVMNGLRPDSNIKFSHRVRFLDDFDTNMGRIYIDMNLLDDNCNVFNIGFMSDWKLDMDEQTIIIDNHSKVMRKILFKERQQFGIFDENLFYELTQMIKRLIRNSLKNLGD